MSSPSLPSNNSNEANNTNPEKKEVVFQEYNSTHLTGSRSYVPWDNVKGGGDIDCHAACAGDIVAFKMGEVSPQMQTHLNATAFLMELLMREAPRNCHSQGSEAWYAGGWSNEEYQMLSPMPLAMIESINEMQDLNVRAMDKYFSLPGITPPSASLKAFMDKYRITPM